MNYCKFLFLLILLSSCSATPDTVVPSPTFNQYASAPLFFRSVDLKNNDLDVSSKDIETKLRNGFSTYVDARFKKNTQYENHLEVNVQKLEVTKAYLQVGGDNDIFSAWKSYDQYIFDSKIGVTITCSRNKRVFSDNVKVSRTTKIPASFSPYKRDMHLLGVLEEYVASVDQALLKILSKNKGTC